MSRRAVAIGITATVLIHLLLAIFGPKLTRWEAQRRSPAAAAQPADRIPEFQIELTPAPPDYIEANPDAPVNTPDSATHYSFQDQQAATPKPVDGPQDEPPVEGDVEKSVKILPGSAPEVTEEEPPPAPPPAPISPPGISWDSPDSAMPEVNKSTSEPAVDPASGPGDPAPAASPEDPQPPAVALPGGTYSPAERFPVPNRDQPLPRPRLAPDILPGNVQNRPGGTSRVGITAVNARFNEYGEYQRRMWEAIVTHWYRLAAGSSDALIVPSEVRLRFKIDQQGEVIELEVLGSSAGTIGTLIVRDAIQSRAPFGAFTEEMRKALNTEEEFFATFRYVY